VRRQRECLLRFINSIVFRIFLTQPAYATYVAYARVEPRSLVPLLSSRPSLPRHDPCGPVLARERLEYGDDTLTTVDADPPRAVDNAP